MGRTTEETIALAKARLEAGRGQEAAQLLKDALREDRGNAVLRVALVETYRAMREPQQAGRYDVLNPAGDPKERRQYLRSIGLAELGPRDLARLLEPSLLPKQTRIPASVRDELRAIRRSRPRRAGSKLVGMLEMTALIIAGIIILALLIALITLVGVGFSAAVLVPLGWLPVSRIWDAPSVFIGIGVIDVLLVLAVAVVNAVRRRQTTAAQNEVGGPRERQPWRAPDAERRADRSEREPTTFMQETSELRRRLALDRTNRALRDELIATYRAQGHGDQAGRFDLLNPDADPRERQQYLNWVVTHCWFKPQVGILRELSLLPAEAELPRQVVHDFQLIVTARHRTEPSMPPPLVATVVVAVIMTAALVIAGVIGLLQHGLLTLLG